jgi:hypothetical protein
MRALGIPPRQEAEFYRVCAAFERAKALMRAGEWPPLEYWVDDLLDPDFVAPSGYTMEEYRRDLGMVPKLICRDGERL